MGPKRRPSRRPARPAPYDPELLENWTLERLREELRRLNISFASGTRRMTLVRKLKEARQTENAGGGAVSQNASQPQQASTSSGGAQSQHAPPQAPDTSHLVELVTSLADSVATLQEAYDRIEQRVFRGPSSSPRVIASAAGSADQRAIDAAPARPYDGAHDATGFNLETAYRRLDEESRNGGELNDTRLKRTRFGYAAESLPLVETISPALRQQIISGRDVNLAALLIPYYSGLPGHSNVTGDRQDARLTRALTLNEFILAFGVYKQVMCSVYPQRRAELDFYERDLVDMGTRYPTGFYEYHRLFSAKAAAQLRYNNTPIDWSVRDNVLFCNIFTNIRPLSCSECDSSIHTTPFCPLLQQGNHTAARPARSVARPSTNYRRPSPQTTDSHGRTRVFLDGQELCNNFNTLTGCRAMSCSYLHACLSCKGNHSNAACPLENAAPQKRKR